AECARVADGAAIGGLVAGDGAVVDAECAAVVNAAADGAGEGAAGERTVVDGGDAAVEDVGARDAVVAGEQGVRDSERATVGDAAARAKMAGVVAGERAVINSERALVVDATPRKLRTHGRSAVADAQVLQHDASVAIYENDPHSVGAVQGNHPSTVNPCVVRYCQSRCQRDGYGMISAFEADGAAAGR